MKAPLRRWIAELRAAPGEREAHEAIARVRVRRAGDVATLCESDGDELSSLADGSVSIVQLPRGVYTRIPTREGRVRLLEQARRVARDEVTVHVTVSDERSHAGRLAIDLPRRAMRAIGLPAAEPGDRVGPDRFAHCFFDEEALLEELGQARLVIESRSGFTFTLRRGQTSREPTASIATEVARVVALVHEVDTRRASEPPERVLAAMRARGAGTAHRGPIGRARLRRAIGWVDAFVPGGANCYRRVLLEIALDAGAARETIVFGLDVGSTGHVAFEGREERTFDVAFAIPATQP